VIAETLAGIALFKASVEGVKSAIGTANDVSSIAKYIDGMFTAQNQVNKDRYKQGGLKGLKDQFGIASVAEEMIDAKLVEEQMAEIRTLVDYRFGHGTWTSIVTERAKRIQEHKELQREEAKERAKKQAELIEGISIISGIVLFAFLLLGGLVIWLKN
tara:strand:+ start:11223 stop:11696 length:474 start_codon:yes stop_codon:yes gene_type:complete